MMRQTFSLIAILTTACGYTAPLDPNAELGDNTLSGTVVLSHTDTLGPVMVLVYDAETPPPPSGTGRPLSLATVPAERFNTDLNGLLSAPFAVPNLPDGEFLLTALMDVDQDFHPIIAGGTLAGGTCGDLVGGYVTDVLDPVLATISVSGGTLHDQISVPLARELVVERSAFTLPDSSILDRALAGSNPTQPQTFSLNATAIHSAAGLDLTGPFDGTDPCDTSFHVVLVDADLNGIPDPHHDPSLAAMGLLDVWPRIYLQYLGETDEGEAYLGQAVVAPTLLTHPDLILNAPLLLNQLTAMWLPGALHLQSGGRESVITNPLTLPAGEWAVSVVSLTGQTWTVPNGLAGFESVGLGFDPAGQSVGIWIE
jgi:hypothetical protein